MTHQEKLTFIRGKCILANPDKDWEDNGYDMAGNYCVGQKNPSLADVLLALPKTQFETWCSAYFLYLRYRSGKSHPYYKKQGAWDLQKTLEDQDGATISFLHDILC